MSNLKQIAIAMHNYHDTYKTFPPAYLADKEGKPLLSWRVAILPFIEQRALYQQFHLDEPWDSPHNRKLAQVVVATFRSPNSMAPPGKTNYLAIRHERSIFPGATPIRMASITDGTSNTILVVEANDAAAVEWTRPDDLVPNPQNPVGGLVGMRPGGFVVALADGSVRFLPESVAPATLWAFFTRDGGEVVTIDGLTRPGKPRPVWKVESRPKPSSQFSPYAPKMKPRLKDEPKAAPPP